MARRSCRGVSQGCRDLENGVIGCRGDKAGSLGLCPLLNASVCHATVEMSNLGHSMVAALYNPLAWPRTEGVRVPINTSCSSSWTVRGQPHAFQSHMHFWQPAVVCLVCTPLFSICSGQCHFMAIRPVICLREIQCLALTRISSCADADGKTVKSQLLPISEATQDLQQAMLAADILPSLRSVASHELAFLACVPPLGYATYTISAERDSAQPAQTAA